jgi:hypothetical protein
LQRSSHPGMEALRGEPPPAIPQASWATVSAARPAPDVAPVVDRSGTRLPAAPQSAGVFDHDAILEDALRAAGVPPQLLDSGHLVAAANLMANEGLAPEDAYDRVMLQAAHDSGLVDPDDWQHLSGLGADREPQPTPAPPDGTPQPRDFKPWPASQEPISDGRETGPSDSGPPIARPEQLPLAMVRRVRTGYGDTHAPLVLASMSEWERRRLLGQKPELPSGGWGWRSLRRIDRRGPQPIPTAKFRLPLYFRARHCWYRKSGPQSRCVRHPERQPQSHAGANRPCTQTQLRPTRCTFAHRS